MKPTIYQSQIYTKATRMAAQTSRQPDIQHTYKDSLNKQPNNSTH